MRTDCVVDPDNQTITLPASFLNTLALGEHSFEAYFTEPDSGSARASFKIVEEKTEDEEDVPVPNTGAFTSEGGSAKTTDIILPTVAIIGLTIIAWILAKRTEKE